ncbi:aromatic ring-hydroxylating dioxygenase subunit alpha [Alkalimonas collagenimarina]|uniref:Aromatic ring-hydroxylating dioxygenase subunit alpha n=1 Tax=Alkalimonas collagenimarina TaxID=400390 RepID=A0ABT9GVP5_9GAMM|nr:aromatic ring-hydroxylating dioxygenase subunit alpha [Alkalimonas collagenimarina]MDP4535115.1 aromatic ring-hydroxylating dioxygenase subunit alpha [Alkalimonas collagenimarina]
MTGMLAPLQRTLPPQFYYSDDVFLQERAEVLAEQWFFVAHRSEFMHCGDFKRIKLLGTDIILRLQPSGEVKGLANRCLHRGATLTQQQTGNMPVLTCPYHAWQYDAEGTLISTRRQAPQLEHKLCLRSFTTIEVSGLILLKLSHSKQGLQTEIEELRPYWDFYGLADASVINTKRIQCKANWKIVTENFLECYHCAPCHPQLSEVEKHVALLEAQQMGEFMQLQRNYFNRALALGHPIPPPQFINSQARVYSVINAVPLMENTETGTRDGKLVAPLMGKQKASDGGFLYGSLGPFLHFSLYSDHAVLFSFTPISSQFTQVDISWLACEIPDAESKRNLCWLWDATIEQDCKLCELVQQQVDSFDAKLGYYTQMEADSAAFCKWYQLHFQSLKD